MSIQDSTTISSLPEECMLKILLFLEQPYLTTCNKVCKAWCALTNDPKLWNQIFPRACFASIDKSLNCFMGKVVDYMEKFFPKVQLNQVGEFNVFFFGNPIYSIKVKLGYGEVDPNAKPDLQESYLVFNKYLLQSNKAEIFSTFMTKSSLGDTVFMEYDSVQPTNGGSFHFDVQRVFTNVISDLAYDSKTSQNVVKLAQLQQVALIYQWQKEVVPLDT